jgi:rhamnose transport system permease protein
VSAARRWRWELVLVCLVLVAMVGASLSSPFYLSLDQITYSLQESVGVAGLLALGLTIVVVVGEIDISLPAILAFANILFAQLSAAGEPLALALPLVLLVTTAAGALNGLVVAAFGLPSLAVTLGAMGAYRALALLFGGQEGHASFTGSYVWLGTALVGGVVPVSLLGLLVVALLVGVLMHATVFGRLAYTVGSNARAAYLSGVRVGTIKVAAFALGGLAAGLASLAYVGQYQSARADNASEILLFVVTAVVLGGVDIFGGRGRVLGVALALLLLGTIRNTMGLANVAGPVQTFVIGLLLIGAVLCAQGGGNGGSGIARLFGPGHRGSTPGVSFGP